MSKPRIIVRAWTIHDHPSGFMQYAVANDGTIWTRSTVGRWENNGIDEGGWVNRIGDWEQMGEEHSEIEGLPPLPQPEGVEVKQEKPKCETCDHAQFYEAYEFGACHRDPPSHKSITGWPAIRKIDWCARHSAKE